ncbi:Bug family tripartite tricarboxylate transporter substrate binding protein [Ramlibacter sp.]|uniref:Bug family tripartite tricarboxylate transporter substrate binding protein n=1 Tax=Ramlibacter sp. TaxID=1917967 RepID=UPI003D12989E
MTSLSLSRRRLLAWAGATSALAAATTLPRISFAQAFPTKAVRLVNPFAPGGSADMTARLFAAKIAQFSGANLFVESVTGAGGTIGSDRVAKSAPDGYGLLLSNVASQGVAPSLYPRLPYDVMSDFEHIAFFGSFPNVLVVPSDSPVKTFAEFMAVAKKPGAMLNFGSAGNGTTTHLTSELFKARMGIAAQNIPFKGSGPAMIALLGGQTNFMFENLTGALPHIQSGKLRALAMTGAKRAQLLPNVPTMQEVGVSDFVIGSWYGLSAPAKTPASVVDYFSKATTAALNDPATQKQMAEAGIEATAMTPAQYRSFVDAEIKRWNHIVKVSGAKLD